MAALVLVALAVVTGCSQGSSGTEGSPQQTQAPGFPVTIADCNGVESTFDEPAERILPLSAPMMEFFYWLGVEDRLIGTGEAPAGISFPEQFREHAATVKPLADPYVAGRDYTGVPFERLLQAQPDLVVTDYQSAFASFDQQDLVDRDIGSYVSFALDCAAGADEPQTTLDLVYQDVENLGAMTGERDEAGAVIADMQQKLAAVEAAVGDIDAGDAPTVWNLEADHALSSSTVTAQGNRTIVNAVIELAGGKNLFGDLDTVNASGVGWEEIAERNPDYIMLSAYGYGGQDDFDTAIAEASALLKSNPATRNLDAVTQDRIIPISYWAVGGPSVRNADAVIRLAEAIHPDKF